MTNPLEDGLEKDTKLATKVLPLSEGVAEDESDQERRRRLKRNSGTCAEEQTAEVFQVPIWWFGRFR